MRAQRRQRLGIALFPLAALALHQLRYELAFGSDAPRQLAAHGHGYLQAITPLVVVAAALGAGGWLARLAGGRSRRFGVATKSGQDRTVLVRHVAPLRRALGAT